ncbi:hypothetical protein ACFWYW_46955 [Nonomuraea sp. NPDC059023]|uniref:hypothetical protein n=1 Tax=unclassified Nonomuraea TaxID=2593643 RepID=UPI0036C51D86
MTSSTQPNSSWWNDPSIDPSAHAPERELNHLASAIAGNDVYVARCRCGTFNGPVVRDGEELWTAYATHMHAVQAAGRERRAS